MVKKQRRSSPSVPAERGRKLATFHPAVKCVPPADRGSDAIDSNRSVCPGERRMTLQTTRSCVRDNAALCSSLARLSPGRSSPSWFSHFVPKIRALFLVILLTSAASLLAAPPDLAQNQIAEAIKASGLTVVHLWAPWCSNCQAELKSGGWTKTVKRTILRVKFSFISVSEQWRRRPRHAREIRDPHSSRNVTILADPVRAGPTISNNLPACR